MKLLVLQWNAYTYPDILDSFRQMGVAYHTETYYFKDKNTDPVFTEWFLRILSSSTYDAVFSVNYFPLLAEACHLTGTKYLSWSYDCPLNVPDIEQTLGYETNYVFLFDRVQALSYQQKGYSHVYHLPLAVNTTRLDNIHPSNEDVLHYSSDLSFVGSLYPSTYHILSATMSDYNRGFLDALVEMQQSLYGQYLFDKNITDKLVGSINADYKAANVNIQLNKEQLVYSIATYVTHRERLTLLGALSSRYQLHLYSRDTHEHLPTEIFKGPVSYMNDMPKVFKLSKINLNITVKNTQSGIPLRALDIMGCGGFLLSNYQPELAEYFLPDEDFVYYEDLEDAVQKAAFYLEHDDLRIRIAQNGYHKVKEFFNYPRQLQQMFDISGIQGV